MSLTLNNIGALWPPEAALIVAAIDFTQPAPEAPMRNEVIAAAARIIALMHD